MTGWFRSPVPSRICACGCAEPFHDITRKTRPCNTHTDCRQFTHTWNDWSESRTLREPA